MLKYLDKSQGWTTIAGSDMGPSGKRFLLTENTKERKFAILAADQRRPTDWQLVSEDGGKSVLKNWDALGGSFRE